MANERSPRNPAFQAYLLLRAGFTAAPILFGLDKFFDWTVEWPDSLAPWIDDGLPGSAQDFMVVVGGALTLGRHAQAFERSSALAEAPERGVSQAAASAARTSWRRFSVVRSAPAWRVETHLPSRP